MITKQRQQSPDGGGMKTVDKFKMQRANKNPSKECSKKKQVMTENSDKKATSKNTTWEYCWCSVISLAADFVFREWVAHQLIAVHI